MMKKMKKNDTMNMILLAIKSRHIMTLLIGICSVFLLTSLIIYKTIDSAHGENSNILRETFHQQSRGAKILRHSGYNYHKQDIAGSTSTKIIQHVDPSIVRSTVEGMRLPYTIETVDTNLSYNIHECPAKIPKGYPVAWNIIDVLNHWNPDDTKIPLTIHQGLCTLDWRDERQREIAETYRKAEVPFLLSNHDGIWETAERWSHKEYLSQQLQQSLYRNEHSTNNHMMFWKKLKGFHLDPPGWKPPTENVEITYEEWYEKAMALETEQDTANSEHWYFRLNGDYSNRNAFLFDDLPIFDPTKGSSMFMVDPTDARGINCRLGSKGIIAELHYDFSRNWILLLKGQKRYILAHPDQCLNLELYPQGHPSARHSRINWSDPEDWHTGRFAEAKVNEVVLQAGDMLYLPTAWFHFIVSLNLNYQCNARSGITWENKQAIAECGFIGH